jgi:hypothetical protein
LTIWFTLHPCRIRKTIGHPTHREAGTSVDAVTGDGGGRTGRVSAF